MEHISFNDLPSAVQQLMTGVNELKADLKKLMSGQANQLQREEDQIIKIKDVSKLTHLAVATIYGLVQRNQIPYSKKGRLLYFSRKDILDWINEGKNKNQSQIDAEADGSLVRRIPQKVQSGGRA